MMLKLLILPILLLAKDICISLIEYQIIWTLEIKFKKIDLMKSISEKGLGLK